MMKLFGTDGIRGMVNEDPITPEMVRRIGQGITEYFRNHGHIPRIIIGKDTRASGDMIEAALVAGIRAAGGVPYSAGILPTPGVAYLTASEKADAGIVISASHNPYYDNGIKVFGAKGFKLSDQVEAKIEALIHKTVPAEKPLPGDVQRLENAREKYIDFLAASMPGGLAGMKIVMDCANGATFQVAPALFQKLGAEIETLGIHPDGENINLNCGSQHPETLIARMQQDRADIGVAFDGDGDRLIAVDENGRVVTGDQILAVCARTMQQKGTLKNNTVVSTVMSNLGLGLALKRLGIRHVTSQVGDRYVLQDMLASGAVIGGEDSGHMIFLDHHTTGDGILTALRLIEAMQFESRPLSALVKIMDVFPQVLMNVPVTKKPDVEKIPEIQQVIKKVESELGEKGRVLVRYSGTQPLCRVMVEGPSREETRHYCEQIAAVVKKALN